MHRSILTHLSRSLPADLFVIGLLTKLLGRIYYQSYTVKYDPSKNAFTTPGVGGLPPNVRLNCFSHTTSHTHSGVSDGAHTGS